MNEPLRTASARSFNEPEKSDGDFFHSDARRPGIEFSRREITAWLLFFGFVLILLLIVLSAGKYFMLN